MVSEREIEAAARAMQIENRPDPDMLNDEQRDAQDAKNLPAYMKLARVALQSAVLSSAQAPDLIERCAKIAEAERMTGTPPIGIFSARDIEVAIATCSATARTIAEKIRALAAPQPPAGKQ